jgi:hypothetical protein
MCWRKAKVVASVPLENPDDRLVIEDIFPDN